MILFRLGFERLLKTAAHDLSQNLRPRSSLSCPLGHDSICFPQVRHLLGLARYALYASLAVMLGDTGGGD